jgi:hypothetical protein
MTLCQQLPGSTGYFIRVFTQDHGNPHVHVLHSGALMKVWLGPVVTYASYRGRKPRKAEIKTAVELVLEYLPACWEEWKRIYG